MDDTIGFNTGLVLCKDVEASNTDFDSSTSLSLSSNEDSLGIIELMHNFPNEATPFVNKKSLVSASKQISVTQSSENRKALLNNFKEFSHTLSSKFLIERGSISCVTNNPPLI